MNDEATAGAAAKATLHRYLRARRADLLGKLDGLAEYEMRRPLTATGTNLLGLVKHVASVELGYFTDVFGRPSGRELPWFADGAEPDAGMWASADDTSESIVELHRFAADRADATIEALELDNVGEVPWWPPERRVVTPHQILVHMCGSSCRARRHPARTHRRRVRDGPDDPNVTSRSAQRWSDHRARIEAAAERHRA